MRQVNVDFIFDNLGLIFFIKALHSSNTEYTFTPLLFSVNLCINQVLVFIPCGSLPNCTVIMVADESGSCKCSLPLLPSADLLGQNLRHSELVSLQII